MLGYTPSLVEGSQMGTPTSNWIQKAQLRIAECEGELRKVARGSDGRGYQKILRRIQQYRELAGHLDKRTLKDPQDSLAALEHELTGLKNRMLDAARNLVASREGWRDLKRKWGRLVDEIMRWREARGQPPGRVPRLDFSFPAPRPGASREEREVYDLIRSLGL